MGGPKAKDSFEWHSHLDGPVLCEDVHGQRLVSAVDEPDGLAVRADVDDGQDRPEDLLLHDRVLGIDVGQDRQADVPLGLVVMASCISKNIYYSC